MEALRTPDSRFANLPGFPFSPHYLEDLEGFAGLRMHYLDEGPREAPIALCLHGQPTWSYLYRKMIPALVAGGLRVLAPDLFGFGRSDKPVEDAVYTFTFHRQSLLRFAEHFELRDAVLVCQDWGGLLGLTLPVDLPSAFNRLLVMNTSLGTGDRPLGEGFLAWRAFSNRSPDMDIASLMRRSVPQLSPEETQAYAAPFPDVRHKAGVRRFPNLVPDRTDADGAEVSRRARSWWENDWSGRAFMAIGMRDPVLGPPVMNALRTHIKNCPPPFELEDGGHFAQEVGGVIVEHALRTFAG
jgi:haloalkane dehalogenase/tRNA(adenine34) deaminase